ncbi:NUDIX hydrolase [Candidatus Nanohalobium constans]|uniref:8-oxo-dGTP diphosphatase n=1 Tax=Candidatus Nanohalobium constans TaxID=2565781 RepID=A0A5Q0UFA9_9ARCH|nr:NUDIX domain-containing protein [Candidatus Nanohalobium constans]QGA80293.1 8-oxo-dGTP diphosphatase [Candidatus Nanohalobium constans]
MSSKINVSKTLIRNNDGEFLIVKKSSDYGWKADKWELPGGKMEEAEDRFEAAKREIRSEANMEIDDLENVVRMEIEADETVNCFVLYTDSFSGEVELSEEHQDYRWISRDEAREVDWHRDAGYIIPVVENLEYYLERNN